MQPKRTDRLKLPKPDASGASHSRAVAAAIRLAIDNAGGSISFAEYMQQVLYAPGLGYYAAGAAKFGAAGDFVTAPELSPLFGAVLAQQSARVFEQLGGGDLLEPGAGTGALAVSILRKLSDLDALPRRYLILEVSPDLQERQERRLHAEVPEFASKVTWIEQLPENFSGVVIANEVVDALPVERFRISDGKVLQARVSVEGSRFVWVYADAPPVLQNAVKQIEADLGVEFAEGYESEVSLSAQHWVSDLARAVSSGFIFIIDYGLSRREYYARERNQGWLRCHFRHHAHNEPLIFPGIQDVTAWVDFSAIAEAASSSDMTVAGYVTQAELLLHGGLQDELADFSTLSATEQAKLSGQVKLLTLPAEMGENFKCLGLSRGDLSVPPALSMSDRTHRL
ncbi:MAG: class I SAM-dependent methyltransferase [Woeseiaceae bacterium]